MNCGRQTFRRAIWLAIDHTEKDEKAMGYTMPSAFLSSLKELLDNTDVQKFSQRVDKIELVD